MVPLGGGKCSGRGTKDPVALNQGDTQLSPLVGTVGDHDEGAHLELDAFAGHLTGSNVFLDSSPALHFETVYKGLATASAVGTISPPALHRAHDNIRRLDFGTNRTVLHRRDAGKFDEEIKSRSRDLLRWNDAFDASGIDDQICRQSSIELGTILHDRVMAALCSALDPIERRS